MNQGRIEQEGAPQEVWEHPASPFVYGFLGDVNLFHGRVEDGELLVGAEGMSIPLQGSGPHQTSANKRMPKGRPCC